MDQKPGSSSKNSDEQEVFEVRDYTTASEWEQFMSAFEEILGEWNLTGQDANILKLHFNAKELENAEWHEKTATIEFADYSFNATHHYALLEGRTPNSSEAEKDSIDGENLPEYLLQTLNNEVDFASKSHCITRWFGLQQFIILSSSPSMEPLTTATRVKLVLSALAIAANNTNCQIPLFVQTRKPENKVYTGVAISNGLRTDFDMAYVKQLSARHTDLDGILTILKQKVSLSNKHVAEVAAKFTYKLSLWPNTKWTQKKPDYDPLTIDFDFSNFTKLPLGAVDDLVSDLYLATFCPKFRGDFDNPHERFHRSYLDPKFLNEWSVRVEPPNYLSKTLLAGILRAFLDTSQNRLSIRQILGAEFDPLLAEEQNISSALNKLTSNPVPFLEKVISRTRFRKPKRQPVTGPLCDEVLVQLLNFLFPDACKDEPIGYREDFSQIPKWNREFEQMPEQPPLKPVFTNMKSCPIDSFVYRLMIVSCYCIMSIGKGAIAQLIYELYLELRFRWDNSLLIPGVETGLPNLATCLFNQKIQMFNYCVEKRKLKEGKCEENKLPQQEGDSDDEFFECNENTEDVSDEENLPSWDKPVGRLRRMNNLRLLNSRSFLYVPVTQESPPFTEDRLEQQKDDLMRLGSDTTASQHRARMMSVSLLSDMESFKAANPRCVLEDFVRWYSPRDWLEKDEGIGRLSDRMLAPGNLWQEVWQSAVPVPTRRQKRLFDETRESESVLQWIGNLAPGTFCRELLPVMVHACLARITEESILYTLPASVSVLPMPLHCCTLFAQLELVAQRALRISRHCPPDLAMYEALLEQLRAIEIDITRAKSLRFKILGHAHISSASFNYSVPTSTANTGEYNSEKGSFPATSPSLDKSSSATSPTSDTAIFPASSQSSDNDTSPATSSASAKGSSVTSPVSDGSSASAPPSDVKNLDPNQELSEEKILLEKLVYKLLSNREIPIEDSPHGPQSQAFIKLFKDGLKESKRREGEETKGNKIGTELHFYENPNHFFLGQPFAREYLLRTKSNFPAGYSRMVPHRIFFVVLPTEFRMAGAITQDTLFS